MQETEWCSLLWGIRSIWLIGRVISCDIYIWKYYVWKCLVHQVWTFTLCFPLLFDQTLLESIQPHGLPHGPPRPFVETKSALAAWRWYKPHGLLLLMGHWSLLHWLPNSLWGTDASGWKGKPNFNSYKATNADRLCHESAEKKWPTIRRLIFTNQCGDTETMTGCFSLFSRYPNSYSDKIPLTYNQLKE